MELREIVNKHIYVRCNSREEAKEFVDMAQDNGYFWRSSRGERREYTHWDDISVYQDCVYYSLECFANRQCLVFQYEYQILANKDSKIIELCDIDPPKKGNLCDFIKEVYGI